MGVVDDLARARDAFERREWISAYEELGRLGDTDLAADDFAALATAAHLLGRRNDCVQALQRAYQAHLAAGAVCAAARDAFWLGLVLVMGGEAAVGGGWVSRAQRLLDDVERDVVERGYLLVHMMLRHAAAGDYPQALDAAVEITDYGHRFGDADLVAVGLNAQGRGRTMAGEVPEGMRLLDEAMVGVVAGEVSPIISGMVYCSMIEACLWVSDYGRMGEWTHALTTWCQRQPGLVAFTGQCAVHRGQLMRLHGAWHDALDELELAAQRYALMGAGPAVGLVHEERGETLRLLGRYDAADSAFEEARRFGNEAPPGAVLLALARGRVGPAVAAARRLLADAPGPVQRNRILPGVIEVLLEAGHVEEAAALSGELSALAESFGSAALQGSAAQTAAQVALARGDAEAALTAARAALRAWASLSATYEAARSRLLGGRALRMLGEEEGAAADLIAARQVFADLGAAPAAQEASRLLGQSGPTPGGLSPREVEVLRLVAVGQSNPEIAAALVLSERTVARHLSNIFAKLDVRTRTAAAAFAYDHRLV